MSDDLRFDAIDRDINAHHVWLNSAFDHARRKAHARSDVMANRIEAMIIYVKALKAEREQATTGMG